MLGIVLFLAAIPSSIFIIGWLPVMILQSLAVPGSHKRYVLTNMGIILTAIIVMMDLADAIACLINEEYLEAGLWSMLALMYIYVSRRLFRDDNWFNNQFQKLKKGVKNFGEKLIYMFTPSPSPA